MLGDLQCKSPRLSATCYAPTNIALVKYWGKRNEQFNLPMTASLSLTLPDFGTTTTLKIIDTDHDQLILGSVALPPGDPMVQRISAFLDIFRPYTHHYYQIVTKNSLPIAAGLASSASGFAALTLALNQLYDWQLDQETLSMLARFGSGSACRSFWQGFVVWHRGIRRNGFDSKGSFFAPAWAELCLGLLVINAAPKLLSSRHAMQQTVKTSKLYQRWELQVAEDLVQMQQAILAKDFEILGTVAEANALTMHATMMSSRPPIVYSTSETWQFIECIWELRRQGIAIYFTQDAGPNIKLIFLESDLHTVIRHFPEIQIQRFK